MAALRYRDFRLIWFGRLLSTIGAQMQLIAINWHIFDLLRDQTYTISLFGQTVNLGAEALGLGTLGLVRIIPIALFALWGGVLADTRNRRQLMIWVQIISAILAAILAGLTMSGHITIPLIYLLTAAGSAAAAFDEPSRQSIVPNLVPEEHLGNAVSLNTMLWQLATIAGPGLAGLLLGIYGVGFVYLINALSFGAVIIALLMMDYRGKAATKTRGLGWQALVDGIRYTYRSRLIWSTMLLDFFATFFSSARTMLPIVAGDVLGVGVEGYGLLATAAPVGAVLAGSIVAWQKKIPRQGIVLLVSVAIYGAATALFGLSTIFIFSYFLFALTGAGDLVSTVIRGTLRQLITPDHLRGRMTSVNMIFFMGGPQLGELEAGLVAAVYGVSIAIFTGGLATVLLTGWIAWKYPRLRRYTGEEDKETLLAVT